MMKSRQSTKPKPQAKRHNTEVEEAGKISNLYQARKTKKGGKTLAGEMEQLEHGHGKERRTADLE
jgi:hypothetical protein